jgi:hypothetical protein
VIFWCTIWKADVPSQDHRHRPQDSSPVIILDRKSGHAFTTQSPAVITFIWIWSSVRMGRTYFTHMYTHTHTHTHTQSGFRMQTTNLYEMPGWFSMCSITQHTILTLWL